MWTRFLLVSMVAVLLVAWRVPLRQGVGVGGSLSIKEPLGTRGAAGTWIQSSLQDQLVGKHVHYMRGENSWSGEVIKVEVKPFSTDAREMDRPQREIDVTVKTLAGMGDEALGGDRAVISLAQISGIIEEAHPHVGSSVKVTPPGNVAFPAIIPDSPIDMFVRGSSYPNKIVAVYSDGYVEVDVTGLVVGGNAHSGSVFIHLEDILHNKHFQIVSPRDLENTDE